MNPAIIYFSVFLIQLTIRFSAMKFYVHNYTHIHTYEKLFINSNIINNKEYIYETKITG